MNRFQKTFNKIKNFFDSQGTKKQMQERSKIKSEEKSFLGDIIRKVGYSLKNDYRKWQKPDFDLVEVQEAYDTDSYVRQALDKYIELMFKQGWGITYRDRQVKRYLKRRLVMIGDQMGQPFNHFLRQVADDLVTFHNVFIAKKRRKADNQPNMPGVDIEPINGSRYPVATYTRLPPHTMKIKTDEKGKIKKYKQQVRGKEQEFNPKNMIHIAYKKPAGKLFGVPFLLPALDDVRLLREIEDNVSKLLYRHLYPLFVYEIGNDNEPVYEETEDSEVDAMKHKIENMPIDGGLVIPGQHNIDLLTVDEDIGAADFLEYYEQRVFTGLGVSETLMGRGGTANRSTAETQASEMRDKVKAFQTVLENYINNIMFRELLMEAGYDPIVEEDHKAKFKFNEIDTDLLIKRENHSIYKFEHNAITHEEMREELGHEPLGDEEEERLHGYMFTDPVLEAMAAGTGDNRSDDEGDNDYEEDENKEREIKLENRFDSMYVEKISSFAADFKTEAVEIFNSYEKNSCDKKEDIRETLEDVFELYTKKVLFYLKSGYRNELKTGIEDTLERENNDLVLKDKAIGDIQDEYVDKLEGEFSEYKNNLYQLIEKIFAFNNITTSKVKGRCDHVERLLLQMCRATFNRAYNIGQYEALNSINEDAAILDQDGNKIESTENLPHKKTTLNISNGAEGG